MANENKHPVKHRRLFVGILCLLLILAGSGFFFVTKIEGSGGNAHVATKQPTTSTAIATTPPATPTAAPTLTPTGTPSTTPTDSPTASPTPTPLFSDNFVDNSKGWATGDVDGYTRSVSDNMLLLTSTNHRMLIESLPTNKTYNNFSLTVTLKLLMADAHDSVGIYLRGDSNLDHDYRIDIFGDNTYAISKETLDTNNAALTTKLVEPSHSSRLSPVGQENTLTIIMKGPELVLLINGTMVQSITDTDYKQGQIAFFVSHGPVSAGVSAAFTSIEIDPVTDQLSDQS